MTTSSSKLNFQHTPAAFAQAVQKAARYLGCTPEQVLSGLAMDWERVEVDREMKAQLVVRYAAGVNELGGNDNK
jgi:hypothetical protein